MTTSIANLAAPPVSPGKRSPALLLTLVVAGVSIAAMATLRLIVLPDRIAPIGYGVPLLLFVWLGNRRVMWSTTVAFAVISAWEIFHVLPASNHSFVGMGYRVIAFSMVLLDLLVIAGGVHWLVGARQRLESQNANLESNNRELATREEEIAHQNEELQSQTEELERQSEELRVANEELARRERSLESLLSLSRSLVVEAGHSETMDRICQTLGELINGGGLATAILEQQGDELVVLCHHGFGPEGIKSDRFPYRQSFASLVIDRSRTGYLEDVTRRPDLQIPQPREGPLMQSVLAAPLRVRGRGVGSLEVYHAGPKSWTDEHISLLESLAAQTSISLESTSLFEQAEQERQRLRAVLNTVPIGMAICDGTWPHVSVNPAASVLLNIPADSPIAAPAVFETCRFLRDGNLISVEAWPIARAHLNGDTVIGEELELLTSTGRRLNLLVGAAPIRDRTGKRVGAVSTFADVTPLKLLQRELDFRRREAEEASVRKSRFLAAVSHDIRTPANAISLLAELMQRTASTPALASEVPEIADDLKRSALTLVDLVSDVLDLTRFDSGRIDLHESQFSLLEMLQEECRGLSPLAREKGLAFHCDGNTVQITVRTDRVKLSRILGNLINNAIKFTEAGTVDVRTHRVEGGGIRISVTDTGSGIAPEHQQRIFDEFFQLRAPGRDSSKGSGLGLAICKRLIEAMGGEITVESAAGKGSTFTVTLPESAVVPA